MEKYEPNVNGAVDFFNKTLLKWLDKIFEIDRDDYDDKVPIVP